MNPIYRAWWRMLMDLRPLVRFSAERFPKLAPWTIRLRSALHLAIGNPIQTLAGVDVLVHRRARDEAAGPVAGHVVALEPAGQAGKPVPH